MNDENNEALRKALAQFSAAVTNLCGVAERGHNHTSANQADNRQIV